MCRHTNSIIESDYRGECLDCHKRIPDGTEEYKIISVFFTSLGAIVMVAMTSFAVFLLFSGMK